MKRALILVSLLFVVGVYFSPFSVDAAGLIPCGGNGEPECQACHLVDLGQGLLNWFIKAMAAVIALIFAWGGLKMVMSGGSTEGVSEAKGMMTNAVIGFVILLGAWLIINTIMNTLVNPESGLKFWNQISCVDQPAYIPLPEGTGRPVVGGGDAPTLPITGIESRIAATNPYKEKLCTYAVEAGLPQSECAGLQAIMAIESAGKVDAQSPYASGLMQLTPATAQRLNDELAKLPPGKVGELLKTDPDLNMKLGAQYYAELYGKYGADYNKVYAAYNGGAGANNPSQNCDNLMRWECLYDNDAHTIANTGYAETRNYVKNVTAVREKIEG